MAENRSAAMIAARWNRAASAGGVGMPGIILLDAAHAGCLTCLRCRPQSRSQEAGREANDSFFTLAVGVIAVSRAQKDRADS